MWTQAAEHAGLVVLAGIEKSDDGIVGVDEMAPTGGTDISTRTLRQQTLVIGAVGAEYVAAGGDQRLLGELLAALDLVAAQDVLHNR